MSVVILAGIGNAEETTPSFDSLHAKPTVALADNSTKEKLPVIATANLVISTLQKETNKTEKSKGQVITVKELLADVSEGAKKDFFDSLVIVNGAVASVKTADIQKQLVPEKFSKIMDMLMPAKSTDGKSREIKENEACESWIHYDKSGGQSQIDRGCSSHDDYRCDTDACK